jgi:hypothetical protein
MFKISSINENWFRDGFKTHKLGIPEHYKIASGGERIQTLENDIQICEPNDIVMTGMIGEHYIIKPLKFVMLKIDCGNGICIPKPIPKIAKLADHDGVILTEWNVMYYNNNMDYIIRHGPNDYSVIKKDIFNQTYVVPINVSQ